MPTEPNPWLPLETELRTAIATRKCWRCGCFQNAIDTFQRSETASRSLHAVLDEAARRFEPKRYDCLGCEVCWPAVAQNLASDLDPTAVGGDHCAAQTPDPRDGWPPLPGDYQVSRHGAPVAVCVLNSDHLIAELGEMRLEGLSIVGSLHTENLGIEHLIRNTLANPHIRFLILCGEDTRKAVGHLPGQSLDALMKNGVDAEMRIIGAKGRRPLLKNIRPEQVEAFREQVQEVVRIGDTDVTALRELIATTATNDPGPFSGQPADVTTIPVESAKKAGRLVLDPAGYFVVYPDRVRGSLMLEHYTNQGVLDRILSGTSAVAVYSGAIEGGLVSRLDHAAYLGRELARAEHALQSGERYVQDRAPGEIERSSAMPPGKQAAGCGCQPCGGKS